MLSTFAMTLRLDDQLCFALYLASKTMTQQYQPLLQPLKLTYPQYLVLLVLWEEDGINVKRLGQRLHLDSGTLSPLLQKLETRGLLKRKRGLDDERSVSLILTSEGRTMKKRISDGLEKHFCDHPIDADREATLRDSLREFTRVLLLETNQKRRKAV